ncbi:peptide chain release factor 2 [Candidatus Shapirobacteria bacterium]|nr:peptide chain release factor 2 [Candidatus Shapirobacteria bacterium]
MEKGKDFQDRLGALKAKLNLEEKKKRLSALEAEIGRPNFWQDRLAAEKVMREMAQITQELKEIENLEKRITDQEEAEKIEKDLGNLELKIFLGGKYDQGDAILSIHAGQGGTEAMDWAQMLQRMYLRFCERKDWSSDVVDSTPGDEAGIKSVTLTVAGPHAYGYLKGEAGVHRLVRQSPFNADKLRQTSFALVEVLPQIEEAQGIDLKEDDLEWEFFRASSQGGQNVQKVSSAVRLKHKPTGIIVTCQSQRYQEQNRKIATQLLLAKLWALASARAKDKERQLKGDYKIAGWGNQIRSYVLHPYKMVKDLRTGYEIGDPESVLDGQLDEFIEAEIKIMV